MTSISALENVHIKGLFGDYEDKNEKDLLIVQIAQYKNSSTSLDSLKIDELNLKNEALNVSNNNDTRILWNYQENSRKDDVFMQDWTRFSICFHQLKN